MYFPYVTSDRWSPEDFVKEQRRQQRKEQEKAVRQRQRNEKTYHAQPSDRTKRFTAFGHGGYQCIPHLSQDDPDLHGDEMSYAEQREAEASINLYDPSQRAEEDLYDE